MLTNKISWEQFNVCNNDNRGNNYRFEDLCRQLFEYDYFERNNKICYLHNNPNNGGIESEPIYDEEMKINIGYQAKYFDSHVNYQQIENSVSQTIKDYKGKIDCIFIYCNKSITTTCPSYKKIEEMLEKENIKIKLITDVMILDLVRRYDKLGLYYFNQHYINLEWFKKHTHNVFSKIGERYNNIFNVDTKTENKLSLFIHDKDAIKYINDKKIVMLQKIDELNYRYDEFKKYKDTLINTIMNIPDINEYNFNDSFEWNEIIENSVCNELNVFKKEIEKSNEERNKIYEFIQSVENIKCKEKLNEYNGKLRMKIEIYENLIDISKLLELTDKEKNIINAKILVIEGVAGVGKTHLLANETYKLLSQNQDVLMLLGGDYLNDNNILDQICSGISTNLNFFEVLEILELEGENKNCIVPIFIDAINESWNKEIWKVALPTIFNKVRDLKNVRIVITYRSEYRKVIINDNEFLKNDICKITHYGFAEESFEATKKFLNYYKIPFTPLHMFNSKIENPLFLTMYCKTYHDDEVDMSTLYEQLLNNANKNINRTMSSALRNLGYDSSFNVVTQLIMEIADFINETGKKYFSIEEISNLRIWKQTGISMQALMKKLVEENILHNSMYTDTEIYYFSYDQMNDYFCAKAILHNNKTKEEIEEYIKKDILKIGDNDMNYYQNQDLFICVCALFHEKFGEECIEIIDQIEDEDAKNSLFTAYIDSFQWRKTSNINVRELMDRVKKYKVNNSDVWNMFIANSLKQSSMLNAEFLHNILMKYELNKRDYYWTTYINSLEKDDDNRLIQIIKMYSQGNVLEFKDKIQVELLLTLFSWLLTSSSRWIRDYTSKAMVEVLKKNFELCEYLLKKFSNVNDPYIIQRLYAVVMGACTKKSGVKKEVYDSLAKYVYKNIFDVDLVYPDILLRDYARIIIERYLYEYPEESQNYLIEVINPPYKSQPIPKIADQGYLKNDYDEGIYRIINSMRFQYSGYYGDFGRYVFESALRSFDVNYEDVFNYAIYHIINELGYSNELFEKYDSHVGDYEYNRYNTVKLERIGKKYQWITMYNILARIADNCNKKDEYSSNNRLQKYEGPWEPYVRDFDATLNQAFIKNDFLPKISVALEKEEKYKNDIKNIQSTQQYKKWLNKYPMFFDIQKSELIVKDDKNIDWITLVKYDDTNKRYDDKLQIWNWIYGYFVSKEQYKELKNCNDENLSLLNDDITWIPETFTTYCREYPWSKACDGINELLYRPMNIKTGEKRIETYKCPRVQFLNSKIEIGPEETMTREVNIEKNIGNIMCSYVNLLWEEEFDVSKEEAISWYAPCAEFINEMKLQYGEYDGAFYNQNGDIAAFDYKLNNKHACMLVRKDLVDLFLSKKNLCLVWFVNASKEIHTSNCTIGCDSKWTGLWKYEDKKISGDIFMNETRDNC